MELKVSTKNEIVFAPDFDDNLKLAKTKQFKVVIRRTSSFIMNNKTVKSDGKLDMVEYLRESIIRFENNITLSIDGKSKREMEIEDLLEMPELSTLAQAIFVKAVEINRGEGLGRKKS